MKKVTIRHHGNEFAIYLSQEDSDGLRKQLTDLIENPSVASTTIVADERVIIIPREVAINSITEFS